MYCQFLPDEILKEIEDNKSLKLSKKIRGIRNRLNRTFQTIFQTIVPGAKKNRETYNCNNTEDLPGELVMTESTTIGNPDYAILEAHRGAGATWDFYNLVLNRNSLDNKGLTLKSSVHYGEDFSNAFWDGSQMSYGDGDNYIFTRFTKDLSVISHELAHGVTQNTSNLFYYGESGAINESFSDIFGVTIRAWFRGQSLDEMSWLIGDEITLPAFEEKYGGKAIRTFKNEKAFDLDRQPKQMKNKYWGFEDNGGVHINSGLINRVFYEYCIKLNTVPYDSPIKLFYNTLLKLNLFSNFWHLKIVLLQTCEELHGKNSLELKALQESLQLVGF